MPRAGQERGAQVAALSDVRSEFPNRQGVDGALRHIINTFTDGSIMPMLSELRQRFPPPADARTESAIPEETLISDTRSGQNSHQMLEHKFGKALLREQGQITVRPAAQPSSFR